MALQLDPLYDAIFTCPDCGQVFHGPGPLEEHAVTHTVTPNGAGDVVPVDSMAGPVTEAVVPVKRKRGRPRKQRD